MFSRLIKSRASQTWDSIPTEFSTFVTLDRRDVRTAIVWRQLDEMVKIATNSLDKPSLLSGAFNDMIETLVSMDSWSNIAAYRRFLVSLFNFVNRTFGDNNAYTGSYNSDENLLAVLDNEFESAIIVALFFASEQTIPTTGPPKPPDSPKPPLTHKKCKRKDRDDDSDGDEDTNPCATIAIVHDPVVAPHAASNRNKRKIIERPAPLIGVARPRVRVEDPDVRQHSSGATALSRRRRRLSDSDETPDATRRRYADGAAADDDDHTKGDMD